MKQYSKLQAKLILNSCHRSLRIDNMSSSLRGHNITSCCELVQSDIYFKLKLIWSG